MTCVKMYDVITQSRLFRIIAKKSMMYDVCEEGVCQFTISLSIDILLAVVNFHSNQKG